MTVRPVLPLSVSLLCLGSIQTCEAADFSMRGAWDDTKLYVTAPVQWDAQDWLLFGGTLAAVGAAHEFDGHVRNHFAGKSPVLDGKDTHSTRDAAPAAIVVAGTWALGWAVDSSEGRNEAYRMLEAAALSGATTTVLKYAAGRARPNETLRVDEWRSGGSSFPSLHATAAFAIGTVFAESGADDFRWTRRLVGYGMASATAYLRLHGNSHWLSDVVAGSAIGVSTGAFVMRRQLAHDEDLSINVVPTQAGGISVQFAYKPH